MTFDKRKEKLLDFNFYNHTINNLKLTMSPLEIQQLLQKQHIIQRKTQNFKENTISFDKTPANPIEITQLLRLEKNTPIDYSNLQASNFKNIDRKSTQPNIVNKVYNFKTYQKIPQNHQVQPTNQQKSRIYGIKIKKSSKKPTQIKNKYLQQEEDYQPSQQDFRQTTQEKQLNSSNSSILSDEPAKKPIHKHISPSQSSEQDNGEDEGKLKFFPKDNEYFYNNNQAEQKQMQEYKQIMKSVIMFGFGSKHLKMYLKQTKVKIDPAFFLECRPRYYKLVNKVIFKVAQSIEYFLEKDCQLKIRRITYNEFVCIKNDMLNFKTNYKRKHCKTIEKMIKIILNMEDISLSERKVGALHNYILEKIDKKYKPSQKLGIKLKEKQLSKKMSGPPYTLQKERKLYNAFYRDDVNMFDVKWKNEIQNWFLHYYYQNTSLTYCFQKLKKLYPQYKRKLTPYNLRNYFERILRIAFGKLKAFIQKTPSQLKLPKLSHVSNSAFKKMMSYRDYQKVRLILVRLYRQELTQSNCLNFICRINESIREFQAYEGLGLIRMQYKMMKVEGMNVISLRSRIKKKNREQRDEGQQNNYQDEQQEKSNMDEREKSSIRNQDEKVQENQMKNQQLYELANEIEQSLANNDEENELFSNNEYYFHDDEE